MTQYHVSAQAAKTNGAGSAADPFLTIGQAAAIARAGDEVVVHAGTYRESVDPRFGGESATNRYYFCLIIIWMDSPALQPDLPRN